MEPGRSDRAPAKARDRAAADSDADGAVDAVKEAGAGAASDEPGIGLQIRDQAKTQR